MGRWGKIHQVFWDSVTFLYIIRDIQFYMITCQTWLPTMSKVEYQSSQLYQSFYIMKQNGTH